MWSRDQAKNHRSGSRNGSRWCDIVHIHQNFFFSGAPKPFLRGTSSFSYLFTLFCFHGNGIEQQQKTKFNFFLSWLFLLQIVGNLYIYKKPTPIKTLKFSRKKKKKKKKKK